MHSEALRNLVIDALEEIKAHDIEVLDVRELTDITDYMIVASGRSKRQVVAIAENVIERAKHSDQPPLGSEGVTHGEWALVDLCDVVVHVMVPEARDFYQLEKLWGGREPRKPVGERRDSAG